MDKVIAVNIPTSKLRQHNKLTGESDVPYSVSEHWFNVHQRDGMPVKHRDDNLLLGRDSNLGETAER